jgi:exodeoxyribonuclease VII small subunit
VKKSEGKDLSYRELRQELDSIIAQLQSDDLDVETALALYARGRQITDRIINYLKKAETIIRELKMSDTKGK